MFPFLPCASACIPKPFLLEGSKRHTPKGHGEHVLKVKKFRVLFRIFSGGLRVSQGGFSLCPFWVCPLDPSDFDAKQRLGESFTCRGKGGSHPLSQTRYFVGKEAISSERESLGQGKLSLRGKISLSARIFPLRKMILFFCSEGKFCLRKSLGKRFAEEFEIIA